MDQRWLDRLARGLAQRRTRRVGLAQLAAILLADAGVGQADAGRTGTAGRRGRRRRRCRPECRTGYACIEGRCACASGVACGEACCAAGESCLEGACEAAPPPPTCIGFGEPCKGVGRPCCDGLACGSGPGGMTDVGCYRPAGSACATTDDCTFGATCEDGTCVAIPVPPPCTVCPSGCPFASVAEAVEAAPPGAVVTVADGIYEGLVTIDRDLTLEACDGGRPLIRNVPTDPTLGPEPSIAITAGRVTLRGLVISCSTCDSDDGGGGLFIVSPSALGAARRVARRLGSARAALDDPRRTMRLGRAAFGAARAGARDAAPPPDVRVIDCEITGIRFPSETVAAVAVIGASVTLTDTVVSDNQGALGGGVLVIAGAAVLEGDTEVRGNAGLIGSGVFAIGDCLDGAPIGEASVIMRDRARVSENRFLPEALTVPQAFFGGGGVTLWAASLEMTGDAAVERNLSMHIGGGIAVLSGAVTLGCDDCPGTVRVAGNAAMGYAAPAYGGGIAVLGYAIGPVESADAHLTVRGSARITDNVAYGPFDDPTIPGAGGGIFAAETNGAVVVDMTTASAGDDPAVTRNRAAPAGGIISGPRDAVVGVGGVVYDAETPTEGSVPGVSLLTVNGNDGDQCGGDLNADCTLN